MCFPFHQAELLILVLSIEKCLPLQRCPLFLPKCATPPHPFYYGRSSLSNHPGVPAFMDAIEQHQREKASLSTNFPSHFIYGQVGHTLKSPSEVNFFPASFRADRLTYPIIIVPESEKGRLIDHRLG